MKRLFFDFSKVIIIALLAVLCSSCAENNKGRSLNLASFNIRYGTPKDTAERNWDARKASCIQLVKDFDFHVTGFQEVLPAQQRDLIEGLADYNFMFVGRDDGVNGEAVGIGYRKDRIAALDSGCFWLSPTPDVPSNSLDWGGITRKRVAVWYKFQDKTNGRKFFYLTTHMEVSSKFMYVREKSADLIMEKEREFNPEGIPFFVVGDLNPISQDEQMLLKLRSAFRDSYYSADSAGVRFGPTGTYNGFRQDADLSSHSKRGDYIFGKGEYQLNSFTAIDAKYEGRYPSDHIPVMISINL